MLQYQLGGFEQKCLDAGKHVVGAAAPGKRFCAFVEHEEGPLSDANGCERDGKDHHYDLA